MQLLEGLLKRSVGRVRGRLGLDEVLDDVFVDLKTHVEVFV
jgi:hypothetical protein